MTEQTIPGPGTTPSTVGMLLPGDHFSQLVGTTIFTVEEVSVNPLDEDELHVTVTTFTGEYRPAQVFPLHHDHPVTRWLF